ncbi:MAG: hypothetical protein R2834_24560 [Rhodothermales bacterium]
MQPIDYAIIVAYLVGLVWIGVRLQRKASEGIESYFLGNRSIPWWALGASGMATNLDVAGTMVIVALMYALGIQGFYIEIRGGVVLIMAFLMVYMGKWNRRSQSMTVAEWMTFRFGTGRQGDSARALAAAANLIFAIASVTYFAHGIGLFVGTLMGIPPEIASLAMIGLATAYTVASGLYGVVYTDLFQGVLIFFTLMYVTVHVFLNYSLPETFSVSVPLLDGGFETIGTTLADWATWTPRATMDVPGAYSQYNLLGMALAFYMLKVVIEGSGGAGGGHMVQRFFSSASDREAGLISLLWTVLLAFRWPFIVSIAIMGISYGAANGVIANPEEVLPIVVMNLVPVGIKGLLVAGLVSAAMSTFDSTVNAAAAYWVRDIYQHFMKPLASEKALLRQGRWASLLIVVLGVGLTYAFTSINDIWGWLTMGLSAGLMLPQVIRWYWWRFNGYGFAGSTLVGMVLAFGQKLFAPGLSEMASFGLITALTLASAVVITLLTSPTPDDVLDGFFRTTRPFGIWGPVRRRLPAELVASIRAEGRRDLRALLVAIPWQLVLFLAPMVLVLRQWGAFAMLLGLLAALSVLLYLAWYRHLGD